MRLSINTAEIVYARIGTLEERADTERCLERVKALDPGLWLALDAAIGSYTCACIDAGFVAGWEAAKAPGTLIFAHDPEDTVHGQT